MKDEPQDYAAADHVADHVRPVLAATDDERIEYAKRDKWIPYPRAIKILGLMSDLLTRPRSHRMPNLLIVGESNNGKSMILERFRELHPVVENAAGTGNIMPVVRIQLPPVPDEGRFYGKILDAVRVPYRTGDSVTEKERVVLRMIERLEVKLLLIDEIHHALAGSALKQRHFLNVLKHLSNESRVAMVGAGTEAAFHATQSDEQLGNRFPPALLPRWQTGEEWDRLVLSFTRRLPLRQPSALQDKLTERLREMSEGKIGELHTLLGMAAEQAIRSGRERIELKTLQNLNWVPPSERRSGGGDAAA
jgi:hypothetical protein